MRDKNELSSENKDAIVATLKTLIADEEKLINEIVNECIENLSANVHM